MKTVKNLLIKRMINKAVIQKEPLDLSEKKKFIEDFMKYEELAYKTNNAQVAGIKKN